MSAKKTRKPARTPQSEKPAAPAILPMTAGGKTANVRVKKAESGATMIRVWGAHERVTV